MKSFPFDPATADGLAWLVTIQKGAETIRFTTVDRDITIGADTWSARGGATVSNLELPGDGSPGTCDVTVASDPNWSIKPGDGIRGALEGWPITLQLFDIGNPGLGIFDMLPGAVIGEVQEQNYLTSLSVNGPLTTVGQFPITEHFSLTGREDLGDDRCKIPIVPADIGRNQAYVVADQPAPGLMHVNDAFGRVRTGTAGTVEDYANVYYECVVAGTTDTDPPIYGYDPTVGNITVDGTAQFIARDAWLRHARGEAISLYEIQFTALPDPRASDDTWYKFGGLYVRSGVLQDYPKFIIADWNPDTLVATLFLPVSVDDLPADTQFEIHAGCDQTPDQCLSRFNNIANIRAEFFVPPPSFQAGLG